MKSVCLVMTVKDEAAVVRRCLDSVKAVIDYWVICDTGSTDGTQEIIRQGLEGIPGELHETPWVDFGHNRSLSLNLARGRADYHLLLDADMTVNGDGNGPLTPALSPSEGERGNCFQSGKGMERGVGDQVEADSYWVREEGEAECWVERLVSDRHQWRFVGAARPFLHSATSSTRAKLKELSITRHEEAAAHRAQCQKEVELLKQSLERGSNVPRTTFHLAQCYRDLGNLPLAIEYYEKRATMGGWAEEVWYSMYQVARLQQRLGIAWMLVLDQYLRAYEFRPSRIEPLYHVARYYREKGQLDLGRLFAQAGLGSEYPDDLLFIERGVYEGGLREEHEMCCARTGDVGPEVEPLICADNR